jgi:hypothetical protein
LIIGSESNTTDNVIIRPSGGIVLDARGLQNSGNGPIDDTSIPGTANYDSIGLINVYGSVMNVYSPFLYTKGIDTTTFGNYDITTTKLNIINTQNPGFLLTNTNKTDSFNSVSINNDNPKNPSLNNSSLIVTGGISTDGISMKNRSNDIQTFYVTSNGYDGTGTQSQNFVGIGTNVYNNTYNPVLNVSGDVLSNGIVTLIGDKNVTQTGDGGALRIQNGGAYIGGNLFVKGNIFVNNIT